MLKRTIQFLSLLLAIAGIINQAHAGGIALGSTRVIYPQGSKQVSLQVINSSENNVFLIQSWVANADGSRSSDFIITPPLFVIQPKKRTPCELCTSVRLCPPTGKACSISIAKRSPRSIKPGWRIIHCKLRPKASLNFLFVLRICRSFRKCARDAALP